MDPSSAPIESLKKEMGQALDAAIDKQGGKVAFAARAGLNRATLYRLLRGGNVSTDVLLRTLRALGRADLIAALISPPQPSPLELRPPTPRRSAKKRGSATRPRSQVDSPSLVSHLALGRLPAESDDG